MTFEKDFKHLKYFLPLNHLRKNSKLNKIEDLYYEFCELYNKKDEHERYLRFSFIFLYGLFIEIIKLDIEKIKNCDVNRKKFDDLIFFINKKLDNFKDSELFKILSYFSVKDNDVQKVTKNKRDKILHFQEIQVTNSELKEAIEKIIEYLDNICNVKKKPIEKFLKNEYFIETFKIILKFDSLVVTEKASLFNEPYKSEIQNIFSLSKKDLEIMVKYLFENKSLLEEEQEFLYLLQENYFEDEYQIGQIEAYIYSPKFDSSIFDYVEVKLISTNGHELEEFTIEGTIYHSHEPNWRNELYEDIRSLILEKNYYYILPEIELKNEFGYDL